MEIQGFNPVQARNPSSGGMVPKRSAIGALFLSMAILLVVTVAGTYWIGDLAIQDSRTIGNVHATIDVLNDVLSTYKDAETGQRGYLLTHDESYLTPYKSAVNLIPSQLADLDAKARAGLLPQQDVDQLRHLGDLKLAELKKTIDLAQQPSGSIAALAVVRTNVGKEYMDNIRDLSHRVISDKQQHAARLRLAEQHMSDLRTAAFAGTTIINLLFLLWPASSNSPPSPSPASVTASSLPMPPAAFHSSIASPKTSPAGPPPMPSAAPAKKSSTSSTKRPEKLPKALSQRSCAPASFRVWPITRC